MKVAFAVRQMSGGDNFQEKTAQMYVNQLVLQNVCHEPGFAESRPLAIERTLKLHDS